MRRVSIEIWPADPELLLVRIDPLPQHFACGESLQTGLPLDAHEIDGKEYAAKRGRSPVRKIAKDEGASGAKSAVSTQPPAPERKKTKRAIQTVSKAAGIAVHSSLR